MKIDVKCMIQTIRGLNAGAEKTEGPGNGNLQGNIFETYNILTGIFNYLTIFSGQK
ncbi:MAG TPA: hypothetical protein VEM40_09105 [Nitrospirota bacterium]|nr:hypothetical protein [Nitrospirota bacterium]